MKPANFLPLALVLLLAACASNTPAPVSDGRTGYARYRFSYLSKVAESAGKPIMFEGMCRMLLLDGLIEHYAEVFDRGAAFVQLGFPAGKVARLLEKYAAAQNATPEFGAHLGRFAVTARRSAVKL